MQREVIARSGVPVEGIVHALRGLAMRVRNVVSGAADLDLTRDRYLMWVEEAEGRLRSMFASDEVWRELLTDRYWHIRSLQGGQPRPHPVIADEAGWQAERLEALADKLELGQQQFAVPRGCLPFVPDTNVLIHYRRFEEIDWPRVLDVASARLVVPLLVLDELDRLTYGGSAKVRDRSRRLLRYLRTLRDDTHPTAPVDVRAGVGLQILMDPPGHIRLENNDEEIMRRVEVATSMSNASVTLVSGDYGMQLRAASRGINCVTLPDGLRLGVD